MLLNEWDPIGVRDEPMAQGEYDSYVPQIYGFLKRGADRFEIAAYLTELEVDGMGFSGNRKRMLERNLKVADTLMRLVE